GRGARVVGRAYVTAVNRPAIGRPGAAARTDDLDLVVAERLDPSPRRFRQRAITLDGDNLGGEPRQHSGLVARAGADFEHPMVRAYVELLGHVGDDVGLADGLPARDRQ